MKGKFTTATYKPKTEKIPSQLEEAAEKVIQLKDELKAAEKRHDKLWFIDKIAAELKMTLINAKDLTLEQLIEALQDKELGLRLKRGKFECTHESRI